LLLEFSGTLLVVSHDRAFLDAVVTSTLVFEGGGTVGEYVGGYSDWVRQRKPPVVAPAPAAPPKQQAPAPQTTKAKPRRLTFKEAAELAGLPDRIDALERERAALYVSLSDPAVLRDGSAVVAARSRLVTAETEITELTERWESLETIAAENP
ncbi:MAG TPA: ABC transporter ATP-binding protein, partial [Gemmatimonadaceae bacterium]|nr:ABC transporter ATP-binding protein [Gemmatimonadaceae bacterium]